MKVLAVLQAQSIRAVRAVGNPADLIEDTVRAVVERYHFVRFPMKPEELALDDPNAGFAFRAGFHEHEGRRIFIELLQVFRSAVVVSTRQNTADSDLVLDDLRTWAVNTLKNEVELVRPGSAYVSELEIRLEKSLADLLPILSSVSSAISESVDEFWGCRPTYEPISLNFGFDKTKVPAIAPTNFLLERRSGVPFEQNVYFAHAQLSTDNHIAALSRMERACLEASK